MTTWIVHSLCHMLFRIISYGITVLFSGLMGFMSVRWWTLGVCGCCLCFSQCQDAFWTPEKLCQSSTWYNAAGHLFPCCVQKSSHCNSMINSHLHLFFSPPRPLPTFCPVLCSLTVMPVTCELPGQGTSKRSLITSSPGLKLTSATRWVSEWMRPAFHVLWRCLERVEFTAFLF